MTLSTPDLTDKEESDRWLYAIEGAILKYMQQFPASIAHVVHYANVRNLTVAEQGGRTILQLVSLLLSLIKSSIVYNHGSGR